MPLKPVLHCNEDRRLCQPLLVASSSSVYVVYHSLLAVEAIVLTNASHF